MISFREGKGAPRRKPADRVFQLRLKVVGCRPQIWRRVLVRESMWLSRLHDAVQVLFDWFDYQTHDFAFGDLRFGNPRKAGERLVEDDRDVTLADVDIEHHRRFVYTYDFDEGWQVEIEVEQVSPLKKGTACPACVAGERAGPPEDCGGVEAYHDMLECIRQPDTDLGREWLEWLGPDYHSEACDLEKINKALKRLGK